MSISTFSSRSAATIPTPVKSSTIQGLQRAMLKVNRAYRGFVIYMGAPQWVDKEKAWVVWYYVDQTVEEQLSGVTRGNS